MTSTDLVPVTSTDVAVDPDRSDSAPAGPQPRGRRRLLVGLGVLALLLLAGVVALAVLAQRGAALDDRREAVARAAQQSALNLTSIDNEDYDADVQLVLDGATGTFRSDLESRVDQLREALLENEVVAEGDVIETAVLRSDEDTATVLVAVDGDVRNTSAPEGRSNSYRMRLELERVDGTWKTSMLEFVG